MLEERALGGSDPRQLVRSALTCESVRLEKGPPERRRGTLPGADTRSGTASVHQTGKPHNRDGFA